MQEDSCFAFFINFLFTEYPFIGVEEITHSEQTPKYPGTTEIRA